MKWKKITSTSYDDLWLHLNLEQQEKHFETAEAENKQEVECFLNCCWKEAVENKISNSHSTKNILVSALQPNMCCINN